MHWFALDAKIPVVGYGPGGERFHGVDERARIRDLVETSAVYLRLMRTFAG
jgi:succinyl-diaminopimelate desuccinylase